MSTQDNADYDLAIQIARIVLKKHPTPLPEQINQALASAAQLYPGVDTELLKRGLESLYNVFTPDGTVLTDPTDHEEWITKWRAEGNKDFWRRYELYQEQDKHLPPQSLARLDSLTDRILGLLESPQRQGEWDRRGMVVGQVQSGKTANYTGLVCKAADAGYKLIVVMAGIHNSLRSQTQLRLDEGFLGRDTKQDRVYRMDSPRIGVGNVQMPQNSKIAAHSLTSSDERGDFKKSAARAIKTYIGSDPVVLVIKKNGSILKNLLEWIQANVAEQKGDAKIVSGNIPLLLIDDEADNASINTNLLEENNDRKFKSKQDVTKINSLIRQILQTFSRSAYVGYTATPFANIFIPHDVKTEEQGEDLFPRSFIINLPVPSNYIGPARVFGLAAEDKEAGAGLPIVRYVADSETQLPGSHKKTLTPTALPDSLKEAIKAFILTCAVRKARGQEKAHNTMLVHVTRFVDVQAKIKDLVEEELHALRRRIQYGDGNNAPTVREELRALWQSDYVPTTKAVQDRLPEDHDLTTPAWEDVEAQLIKAVAQIQVRQINGTAKDVLDYYDHKDGLSIIAIGGDKLSRGLTLEGLSVSYYLRASRMYDTLMQMGRWFGYRPGYADVCRLYTTKELEEWYKHITVASEELREDFDVMAAQGLTPEQYGLKVRTHPSGLTITSAGKLRYGTKITVSFAGHIVETYRLPKAKNIIEQNIAATKDLICALGPETRNTSTNDHIWDNVSANAVINYLSVMRGDDILPPTFASNPAKLAEYISLKSQKGELIKWTVMLVNSSVAETHETFGNFNIGLSTRKHIDDVPTQTFILPNRHIRTERHEWIDFTEEEVQKAINHRNTDEKPNPDGTKTVHDTPNGISVRHVRPKERGLLLVYVLDIALNRVDADGQDRDEPPLTREDKQTKRSPVVGFAISFPGTDSTTDLTEGVEYVVNRKYVEEELEGYRQDEELNNTA